MTIESLLIYPPLAIARLGSSETPLDSFRWGEDQTTSHGTGKTTISPALTFRVAEDGRLTSYLPDRIQFKDSQGFRPVCPFFELHSRYSDSSGRVAEAPVTPALLKDHGLRLSQLTWLLHVAKDRYIPLGMVRLTHPSHEYPELRLRFTPAKGIFYGPSNLKERWTKVNLDERYLFLNKDSKWCSWEPRDDDPRGS